MNKLSCALDLDGAAQLLKAGHVVAIPTETVYGLAADISQDHALENVFALKSRPLNHPLIIHIAQPLRLQDYAINIPEYVYQLTDHFWPGPLTVVLQKSAKVSDIVTGGQSSVAIRMPSHPLALKLIELVGAPLAAPSANRFGHISPTQPAHVISEFGEKVPVLEGGECDVGIESTIIDATSHSCCKILRSGMITPESIQNVLGSEIQIMAQQKDSKQVPGALKHHYEPSKPTFLIKNQAEIDQLINQYQQSICLLQVSKQYDRRPLKQRIMMPINSEAYAKAYYRSLREADSSSAQVIAIEAPPEQDSQWHAIWDRIQRSTARTANFCLHIDKAT